jgi:peptidoglycan/xylan/chitin deacetylase (PgdA/CDA1 family)
MGEQQLIARLAPRAKALLHAVGHYERRLAADRFPGVAVLCYHGIRDPGWPRTMAFEGLHVTSDELDAHCALLHNCCNPISLDDWRRADRGGSSLPPRPVLVTFDDGYRTTLTLARPVLERHRIPAVFFVPTATIERQQLAWYDAVALERGEATALEMKRWEYDRWAAGCRAMVRPVSGDDPHAPLSVAELRALADVPGFEIGGHTVAHPRLAAASVERQRDEVAGGKARLESWLGRPVSAFAYPNGARGVDYTPDTISIVAGCGFDVAFTTNPCFATPGQPRLERSRFVMVAGLSAAELSHRLSYSWRRNARA